MNCEKNAVVCEGYPEKQIWKSGKEKAEEGMYLTHLCQFRAMFICTPRHPLLSAIPSLTSIIQNF